ncbi:tRNA-splicing endonuclease subunit Sen34 isoform X1 [Sitophilus oryzae]|uniref:tRNA-intron lyase n=1 Tax=Sitophilus oryzae TaxID=7048 RepID=A0A6J2XMP4_SITOR|nr:tRNA-splicing endonuclease subunit Sen34 isoform X1 [Sitophilus oryzae]XP_030751939.1 tRNA-splicing endonuclease subunit Sen34 isoform X1 [Sitophilus oryzae]
MIKLIHINGDILIYDVESWTALRKDYRIIGQIIGSTSFIPSLPMKLLPEEVLLLLKKNLAIVHEGPSHIINNKSESNEFEESFLKAQQVKYRDIRKAQLDVVIDKIVDKRNQVGDKRSKEEIFEEELNKSCIITRENMLWPIFLEGDTTNYSLVPKEKMFALSSSLKSNVYMDLWEKGYYITNGEKFGGDFLVYFGDPIAYHAIFIVKCVDGIANISPIELIAFGRLGVAVKKRAVLATFTEGKVAYLTINWIDA